MIKGRGPGPLRLVNFFRDRDWTAPLPILAWLIMHPAGPIVVDTGEHAASPDLPIARFAVEPEQEAGAQLRQLGVESGDVQAVVLTHLHGDHMNGAGAFPAERVVVGDREYRAATEGWERSCARSSSPHPSGLRLISQSRQAYPAARLHALARSGHPPGAP